MKFEASAPSISPLLPLIWRQVKLQIELIISYVITNAIRLSLSYQNVQSQNLISQSEEAR